MSTSLEKDLHSVYIDGEMPEGFRSQYESIVSSSEKEKALLKKMQALHSVLKEDCRQKTVSSDFMEESFARLQTKMRYAKNVSLAKGSSGESKSFVSPFVKYTSSFAAAAAVFALVFIPLHYNSLSQAKETAVAAISIMKQNSIEPIAKKDVVIDGNINKEDLPKMLAKTENPVATASSGSGKVEEEKLPVEQKTISATNFVSNYSSTSPFSGRTSIGHRLRERLTAVDPFIPDFSSSSITISVPNFNEIGNNMEIMDFQNEAGN